MKTITLHPTSLLAGGAVVLLALVAMGQLPVKETAQPIGGSQEMVRAKDWFTIVEGQPYTVPPGKLLVVRALGAFYFSSQVRLTVDGTQVIETDPNGGGGSSMVAIPRLLTVAPGSLVEVLGGSNNFSDDAMAYAHLADA